MYGKIVGTGSCLPEKVLTNDDLAQFVETNDEWIAERTGIRSRHVLSNGETAKGIAVEAGRRALEDAKADPSEVDLVIVCTVSSDIAIPCTACHVQKELGLDNAMCFDVNAACSGFLVAYNTAQLYINSGIYKSALLIGVEGLSNIVDWTDRGTCILFGDGAGAAYIKADESAKFCTKMHADGNGGDALTKDNVIAHRGRAIDEAGMNKEAAFDKRTYVGMDGSAVFKFATRQVPNVIKELLEENSMEAGDIDLYLLHQANSRILGSISKRLKIDMDKIPMNLDKYGNTSSASIPILLDEVNKAGKIKPGDKVIMAGFGAGLTWAATYLEF